MSASGQTRLQMRVQLSEAYLLHSAVKKQKVEMCKSER